MSIEWTGNAISKGGAECTHGCLKALLMKLDPETLGHHGNYRHLPKSVKRTWIATLWDDDPMKINATPITEVVFLNLSPDEAKRETETLLAWADAYFKLTPDDFEGD